MADRTAKDINIGVCDVLYYPIGVTIPVALGLSQGGMTLKYEPKFHELKADQMGETPLDDVLIGETVTVEGVILDTSLAKILALMPTASADSDKDQLKAVTFGSRPGLRVTDFAGKFVLHPVAAGDDYSRDIIIHFGANTGGMELAGKLDDEWKLNLVIKGYYDDTKPDGDRLFRIGQEGDYSEDIYKRVIKFWITPANPVKAVGTSLPFLANAMFEDGSTADVTNRCVWVSSDPTTVSLAANVATAEKTGSVVIRAEYIGYGNSTSMVVE